MILHADEEYAGRIDASGLQGGRIGQVGRIDPGDATLIGARQRRQRRAQEAQFADSAVFAEEFHEPGLGPAAIRKHCVQRREPCTGAGVGHMLSRKLACSPQSFDGGLQGCLEGA